MKKLNELVTFKEMYKKAFDKNPFFDKSKFEVKISVLFSVIFIVALLLLKNNNDISSLTEVLKNLTLYIGAGLISMLGFIISGLAIASGTISNKMTHEINKKGKFDSLVSILFSFYYIGKVIGIFVALYFISYLFISIDIDLVIWIYYLLGVVLSYGFFFIIFYSVSLLQTCINLFILSYKYWSETEISKNEESILEEFNSARIDALTRIMFEKNIIEEKETFLNELTTVINNDYSGEIKEKLIKQVNYYYSIEK